MSLPPRATGPALWLQLAPLLLAAGVFAPALGGGFIGADFVYIARFSTLPWADWPALFTREWSGGVWGFSLRELRPFSALSMMIDARLHGADPLGYRLTNLAAHLLATWLVLRLSWRVSGGQVFAALAAGLVFALHPAHAEPVLWITGRTDLFATVLALAFWLLADPADGSAPAWRLGLAGLALFAGVFTKELCAFAPMLLLGYWLLTGPRAGGAEWRRRGVVLLGSALVLGLYWWCRHLAFGREGTGHNLWTDLPSWERQAGYLGWLVPVLPFRDHLQWAATPALGLMHGLFLALVAGTVLGTFWLVWRRHEAGTRLLFFGAGWYLLSVPPLLAVVYFSPRHLYFPTVGLAVAAGLTVAALARTRAAALLATAGLALWCGLALGAAMRPWRHAAEISQQALAAIGRESAGAGPGAVALIAVPETAGDILLWAWSSPQVLGAPFLPRPFQPEQIAEREGNYTRGGEAWRREQDPLKLVQTAPAAVVLHVGPDGRVSCRRVSRTELDAQVNTLATAAADGITSEEWTNWVKALATGT